MGGSISSSSAGENPFDNFVREEFKRLTEPSGRTFLVLQDLLHLARSEFIPVDFSHIGILFVLNTERNGKITLEEIFRFVKLCREEHLKYTAHDFGTQMHAFCILQMWMYLTEKPENRGLFVDWLVKLIKESVIATAKTSDDGNLITLEEVAIRDRCLKPVIKVNGIDMIDAEAVSVLHDVLCVQNNYDIGYQTFLDLLQQAGEESGLMNLSDPAYEDYVPVEVLREFLSDFIGGFLRFMTVLEFEEQAC